MAVDLQGYIDKLKQIDAPMRSVQYWFRKEINNLLLETYDQEEDPYEVKWVEREYFYPHPILNKTGAMRGSFKVSITTAGENAQYTISNKSPYAKYHQYGTVKLPIRKIIPENTLPQAWESRLEDYFSMTLQHYLEEK